VQPVDIEDLDDADEAGEAVPQGAEPDNKR
jgi:hypothetical protein